MGSLYPTLLLFQHPFLMHRFWSEAASISYSYPSLHFNLTHPEVIHVSSPFHTSQLTLNPKTSPRTTTPHVRPPTFLPHSPRAVSPSYQYNRPGATTTGLNTLSQSYEHFFPGSSLFSVGARILFSFPNLDPSTSTSESYHTSCLTQSNHQQARFVPRRTTTDETQVSALSSLIRRTGPQRIGSTRTTRSRSGSVSHSLSTGCAFALL
jgi:hypothetical protein